MVRTDVGAAINARTTTIVEYETDPRGWRMFHALAGVAQRATSGLQGIAALPAGPAFHGYAQAPQKFAGIAPLGLARPVVPTTSTLQQERSAGALDDAALRIFAERLRRGTR